MTYFDDKRVLITGGGSLGRKLIFHLLKSEVKEIRVLDSSEQQLYKCELQFHRDPRVSYLLGDVGDRESVDMALSDIELLIHTASCKFVNYVEFHPFQAIKTNVDGALNVVKASIKEHSIKKGINISSDKGCIPYSIYGLTKALQEKFFTWADRVSGKAFCSIRFPNFFGSDGSVIDTWTRQGTAGLSITVTDRGMERYFISVNEAAMFTLEALEDSKGGEIYIPSELKEHNMMEFAEKYSKNFGVDIEYIGRRLGEQLHEVLMTEGEKERAILDGSFWKIDTSKEYLGSPHYLYDTYKEVSL